METSLRKKEISDLFILISHLEKKEDKNLVSYYSFPRLYGHYEKFIEENFSNLVKTILDKQDMEVSQLKKRILYYFLFINFKEMGEKNFITKFSTLDNDINIDKLEIKKIKSYILNLNIGKNYFNLFKIFDFENDTNLIKLKLKLSLLTKKYEARNHIVHGHLEECSYLTYEDFRDLKTLVEESISLIETVFNNYLTKNCYLKKS